MRWAAGLLVVAGCGGAAELPGAYSEEARHLFFRPEELPGCGSIDAAVSRPGERLEISGADGWLLEFASGALPDSPDEVLTVVRIDAEFDERLSGAERFPEVAAVWRFEGGTFELTTETPPIEDLRIVAQPSCNVIALSRCEPRELELCPSFEVTSFTLPNTSSYALLAAGAPLGPDSALVAARGGSFYEISATGGRELSMDGPRLAGLALQDGTVWLVGPDGSVSRGRPDTGFVAGPSVPAAAMTSAGLTGAPDGSELWLATNEKRLLSFDGSAWQTAATLPPQVAFGVVQASWIGPGDVLALYPLEGLHRYRDGLLSEVDVGVAHRFVTAATWHPELGVVAATIDDQLLVGGRSIDGPTGNEVLSMEPLGAGVVYGEAVGTLQYWSDLTGHCLGHRLGTIPWRMVRLEEGLVVLSKDRLLLDSTMEVTDHVASYVKPIPSPDVCAP